MGDVPFLGSKISLISKCDIRYEGILYSVDAKESTISLSKVKSYGTEGRGDPSCYVAPKNDIYDIIIFRASDVKDLRVNAHEPPGLTDPAIISVNNHKYTGQSAQQPPIQQQQQPSTQQQLPAQRQQQLPTQQPPTRQQQQQPSTSSFINNPNSSSNTNNKSTNAPIGNGDRNDDRRHDDRRHDDRRHDDRRHDDRRHDERRQDERRQDGGRHDGGRRDGRPNMRMSRGGYENNRNHVNPNMRYNNNNNSNNGNNYNRRGLNSRDNRDNRDSRDNRDNNSKGGAPNNYRRGPPPGVRRGRSGDRTGAPRNNRKAAPLKFKGEYDFEEANKIFLDLEGKLKNMKLKDEGKDGVESSGERANSKTRQAPSVSGASYDSEDQIKDGDSKDDGGSASGDFYDRTKSFFDNISCEASERSQGKVNKPNWRKERELNTETFGVSGNYRRGGYRGRSYGANGYHRR